MRNEALEKLRDKIGYVEPIDEKQLIKEIAKTFLTNYIHKAQIPQAVNSAIFYLSGLAALIKQSRLKEKYGFITAGCIALPSYIRLINANGGNRY